jgi:hypothetical protein
MSKSRRKNEAPECSGVYGEKKPSEIYKDQQWTYKCSSCWVEIEFHSSICPNCGEQFDWTKSIIVGAKDYDADREREFQRRRKR